MCLRKPWLMAVGLLLVFALGASSTMATTYIRGYVRPSGDGGNCDNTNTGSFCDELSGGNLLDGLLTSPDTYEIIGVSGIQNGSIVDFTFAGNVTISSTALNLFGRSPVFGTSFSSFSVLPCAYQNDGSPVGPGIYNTNSNTALTSNCTQLGDYTSSGAFSNPADYLAEVAGCPANMVCLQFSDSSVIGDLPLPSVWYFAEDITIGPKLATTPTPEPASLSLLAAGLVGLGVFRRKRGA